MVRRITARLASPAVGLLSVILVVALGIRLMGAGRGLPYLHWEEPSILWFVIGMMSHYPSAWLYSSTYYALLYPIVSLHYWYLHTHGVLNFLRDIRLYDPQAYGYWWYLSPASFYLWARVLNDLLAAATVLLVYFVGRAAYGTAAGLLAAALLALAPGAVYFANVINTDIPMTFFVSFAVLAGFGIIRRGRWHDYGLAGLLAGLAIATQISAAVLILSLVIAHFLSPRRPRPGALGPAFMIIGVLAGIALGTPYVLITPHTALQQMRAQMLTLGGVPSLTSIRQALPGYVMYFVRPSQQTAFALPHAATGQIPAVFALVGAAAGLMWSRRLHLYLLSFPVFYLAFTLGQAGVTLQRMMAVLPFVALFAAAGCLWTWRLLLRICRPAGNASWTRGFAGIALVALLAAPARDTVMLDRRMDRPDTRSAAIEWLRQHAPPGSQVALEQELRWYLPDLPGLPFAFRFAPESAPLSWYAQRHIDFAAVGSQSPLSRLPSVAVFPWPDGLYRQAEPRVQGINLVIDPSVYIVRPKMPEINAAFPVTVGADDMIAEPVVADAVGVYSEVLHLPGQRFTPGSYVLAVAGEWPRLWTSLNFRLKKLIARVKVGDMTVDEVKLAGGAPLGFSTPAFKIDRPQTLPVQIELTFWIDRPNLGGLRNDAAWALHPPTTQCATLPLTSQYAWKTDVQRMTLEAWVYPQRMNAPVDGGESEAPILSKGVHLGYYLRFVGDRSGKIFADLSVAGKFSVGRAGLVALRKWTHIAATYDGREARIYLNGAPAAPEREPYYQGTVRSKGYPLMIGCRDADPRGPMFDGYIMGVRVWDRVLSPLELRIEAGRRYLPDTSAGLVGSWSFQSLVDGKVLDLSPQGNNLVAESLQRVPSASDPPARPVWTSGQNLLRTVRIERVAP